MGQITVFSGPERRRRWSDEQRQEILNEALAPGACVAEVARRRDVSTALVYRRELYGASAERTRRLLDQMELQLEDLKADAAEDGPSFLAMLLFEKYGQHPPLNRQAERFAREGVPLSTSTLADQVGAAALALMPIYRLIEAHVLAAERLHGDDTTVPVMAKLKTDTARLWVYVRDDRPFAGAEARVGHKQDVVMNLLRVPTKVRVERLLGHPKKRP